MLYSHYISPVKSCKYKTLRISKLSGICRSCARRLSEIPVNGRLAVGGEKGVDRREGAAAEKAATDVYNGAGDAVDDSVKAVKDTVKGTAKGLEDTAKGILNMFKQPKGK